MSERLSQYAQGAPIMKAAVQEASYSLTPNHLEKRLHEELDKILPETTIIPQYHDKKTGYIYDLFLPGYKIVIEIQSWAYHGLPIYRAGVDGEERTGKLLWDEEMKRQRAIAVAGYYYFPFSGRDVYLEAYRCARLIRQAVRTLQTARANALLEQAFATDEDDERVLA